MGLAVAAVGSLVAALVLTPLAARAGRRFGAVDRPGHLKIQAVAVSYLGGAAAFVPVAVTLAVVRPALMAPLALALAVGLADDRWGMGPIPRLVAGLAVGALVAAAVPLGQPRPVWAIAIVILTVVLMNAVNLLDGLDGLAGGVGLAAAVGFAVLLPGDGRALALALAGALGGFLVFNRPPARIYLGDGGAYLLGSTFAALIALASAPGQPAAWPVGAALFVAVPLADLAVTLIRRTRAGRHIFTGDRGHVYDQLIDRGFRPARTAILFAMVQASLVVIGVVAAQLSLKLALASAGLVVVALFAAAAGGGFLSPGYRRTTARDDDHPELPSPRLQVQPRN